jgi:hypothetical protein
MSKRVPLIAKGERLRITVDTYLADARHRTIADAVMAELGYKPREVKELRIGQRGIQVDHVRNGLVQTHFYFDGGLDDSDGS